MLTLNTDRTSCALGAIVIALSFISCGKETNEPPINGENEVMLTPTSTPPDPSDQGDAKSTCPQQTVTIPALANIGGPPTIPTGQLNAVYNACFPSPSCGSFQNYTYDMLVGSAMITPGSGPMHVNNYPNVTYTEQVSIINYFLNIARSMAPICSGTKKKVVTGLKFYRDANVVDGINCYATYACCVGAPN